MKKPVPSIHPSRRFALHSLSTGIALALSTAPIVSAATQIVTNCSDSGTGSLRSAMAAAVEGDTVDMSQISCSRITLSSGALTSGVNDLTIKGKGQQTLTIDGGNHSFGVFQHTGTGTLTISDVTITNASYLQGGCISTLGSASLTHVTLNSCSATGAGGESLGGAIGAVHNIVLTSSVLSNNDASDSTSYGAIALGGAAFAGGNVTVTGSTINANTASTSRNNVGGGGIYAIGTLTITNSTVSNNTAIDVNLGGANNSAGGGAFAAGAMTVVSSTIDGNNAGGGGGLAGSAAGMTVTNSTFSGNDAEIGGGIVSQGPLHLRNSTVAMNSASSGNGGGGVVIEAVSDMQSSIIAHNYAQGSATTDLSSLSHAFTISGANNLIVSVDPAITLPAGTLRVDPKLASFLENNGGPTQTLALNSNSPAIGTGNNVLRLASDQRGPGFARMTKEKTDIGAFQTGDGIFASGFE